MKTCAYCGSTVKKMDLCDYYCSFCTMKLKLADVLEYGKRKNLMPASQPSLSDLDKSTSELMCFSTIELLFLLKFARKDRADIYKQRFIIIQAMKEGEGSFTEAEQYTFREYEKATRKCFVLENLLRERIGYYPAKLTDSYIQSLASRMKDSTKKDMVIRNPKTVL
ncbi:hypothetical protein J7I93_09360 [Bacillus sp. ISL-47]|uniref:hypothetical protein n=1 Tax=Bacillus sp. ISL-47 TaxID=2819130 RepID=UPI001BE7C95B|nr:hypothetical protein [Bacillus sp. ISL-47]MBT2688388.1 hypothetical protein [Bacillus sp. ISL-47]MBT2710499.1 hypothetical protein [Pseudomonas sp. ISL-84]